jgi:diguanylate cyclase (GGDEF)-like protein/PAS domain S-box-containing protein
MNRYDLAAQGTKNGLWDWDLLTSRIHYSPVWISMLGCGDMEIGHSSEEWFKRIHPEDLDLVRRQIEAHLEKGSTEFEIQHRVLHKDGCYRWMSCRGVITRDETGQAIRIAGSHSNITAEKVIDILTGLPNRLLLVDRLTRSIDKAKKREDFLFAVLIINLNLFESGINRLETQNTDSLVVAAARRLETSLMDYDRSAGEMREHLVVRSEGEEFIALLDGLNDVGEAKKVAEQLLTAISAPLEFCGREVYLSTSIGIALSVTRYRSADEALRDAETAEHRAKSFGKSGCEVFDTGRLESAQTRDQLEKDLQSALIRNEFKVFYQPVVSLSTRQIIGFEALARWMHPARGMVSPKDFIPIAEKTGIITSLDRWVLQRACRQLKTWQDNLHIPKDLWVSANLSGQEFTQPSLTRDIRETLRITNLDANCLMLELTEQSMIENPEAARNLLMQLRVMGIKIGLDDFGTGNSSLAYLRQFPLDYLKVDLFFIRSIENSTDTREIVRAITVLARQLGLSVIAEGIENSRQLEIVRSLDCEFGQGFLFSKAVDSKCTEDILRKGVSLQDDARSQPATVEKGENAMPSLQNPALPLPSPQAAPEDTGSKRRFTAKRIWGLTAFIALCIFIFTWSITKLNHADTLPAIHIAAPVPPAIVGASREMKEVGEIKKSPSPQEKPTAPAATVKPKQAANGSKSTKEKPAPVAYAYRVIHDHLLGSCKGILTVAQNTMSFAPEKGTHGFELKFPEFTFSSNGDQLTIKAGSQKYRFKSDSATKEERQSQIQKICQNLSSFQSNPPLKK